MVKRSPPRLYTVVYGEKYLHWFKHGLLPSLFFRKNFEALKDSTWTIVTKEPEHLSDYLKGVWPYPIDFFYPEGVDEDIRYEMKKCLDEKRPLLITPPDTIFSNGAIASLLRAGEAYRTVVGMVHMRVNSTFIEQGVPIMTGAQLVAQAWQHMHESWKGAEIAECTNSYSGGISWRYLSPYLVSVQHRLPTPYLVNFKASDYEYFQRENFSAWDHEWPSKLVNEERWRYLASSDAAFAVEITDKEMNVPKLEYVDGPPYEYDAFSRDLFHNKLNRQVLSILRSEVPLYE